MDVNVPEAKTSLLIIANEARFVKFLEKRGLARSTITAITFVTGGKYSPWIGGINKLYFFPATHKLFDQSRGSETPK